MDRPQGLAGERGGEDNIWKLIQFQPLCAAPRSANTTMDRRKEMEISIYNSATHQEVSVDWSPMEEYLCT